LHFPSERKNCSGILPLTIFGVIQCNASLLESLEPTEEWDKE
jgi:hypothetical protein